MRRNAWPNLLGIGLELWHLVLPAIERPHDQHSLSSARVFSFAVVVCRLAVALTFTAIHALALHLTGLRVERLTGRTS